MFVVIFNHNQNAAAIALRTSFAAISDVRLLDSGSQLSAEERVAFDECHPNIYYGGLLNRAAELAASRESDEPVAIVCSDVGIADFQHFRDCLTSAFADPAVQVWAPCSQVDTFECMTPHRTGRLRRVTFVDGFCFAARKHLFDRVCPIDLSINRLGWGPDVQFGYCAAILGGRCAVDDRVEVLHPGGSGYNRDAADKQYVEWRKTLGYPARYFHRRSRKDRYQQGFGSRLVIAITFVMARVYRLVRGIGAGSARGNAGAHLRSP